MAEETKKIDVGGFSLRVRTTGEGEQTYILLHGFADGLVVWDAVAPDLAKDARVVAIDLRGHDFSGGPEGPYQWDDLAQDIIAVAAELGIQTATFVGHSLGGMVALLTALKAPDLVQRLVLIGTATEIDAEQENWCREIIKAGRMNAMQGIAHAIFGPISRKQIEGKAVPMVELAKLMETLRESPITSRMTGVTCPALVLQGENDPALSSSLAEALPNGRLERLPGLGHFPHKNDPSRIVSAIQDFTD